MSVTPLQLDTLRSRVVAGTGHRPDKLGGYELASTQRIIAFADRVIEAARPRKVISGMALGWDQALANAARRNGIPFIAAVPFKGQESRWPFWSRTAYELLLAHASEVVYVCPPGYAAWKMQKRNEWMVANCEALLALWDGSDGGTANCVRHAERIKCPLVNAWSDYAEGLAA